MYEGLQIVVSSSRNWTHYIGLIVSGCTLFVFYTTAFKFALIPRLISVFGLLVVGLQLVAVSMPLFGHHVDLRSTRLWLFAKLFCHFVDR